MATLMYYEWHEWALLAAAGVAMLVILALVARGGDTAEETIVAQPGAGIAHLYKWSRDATTFAARQIEYAREAPLAPGERALPDHVFKINHEIADPTSPRDDGLQLVIESKMTLTLEDEYGYVLRIVPLRGTDFWPIVQAFRAELGDEFTMTISGAAVAAGDMGRAASSFVIYCTWPEGVPAPA